MPESTKRGTNETHLVLKWADILHYCNPREQGEIMEVQRKIQDGRRADGKNPNNQYAVCNQDEPYYDEVLEVIRRGEAARPWK